MVYLTDFIKGCTIFRNYWMLNACMCLCMFASWVQWFLFAVKKHVWLAFSSVQLLSCPSLCNTMNCRTPGFPIHHQLPELAQIHIHRVSDAIQHLILCRPFLLPSIFPSIRVFSKETVLHIHWPTYWSFSISPFNG